MNIEKHNGRKNIERSIKREVVVEEINAQDTVQIRPMCYVSLSIDHRALDAFQTSQFLSTFVHTIEIWGE